MKFSFFMLLDPVLYMLWKMSKGKKPKEDKPQNLEIPTPTIGASIPVLFGTRPMDAPLIAWYGDLTILKIQVDGKGKKGGVSGA
jgi:hypothetical protein